MDVAVARPAHTDVVGSGNGSQFIVIVEDEYRSRAAGIVIILHSIGVQK